MKAILNLFVSKDELRKKLTTPSIISEDEVAASDGIGAVIIKDRSIIKDHIDVADYPDIYKIVPPINTNSTMRTILQIRQKLKPISPAQWMNLRAAQRYRV